MNTFYALIMLTLALAMNGCTTDDPKDLDLPMSEIKVEQTPKDAALETKSVALSAFAMMNWQRQFMQPPDADQRQSLTQRLSVWKDTHTADDLLKKARVQMAIGQDPAAEASLRSALRIDANNTEALIELAQLYIRKRDYTRSFEFVSQLRQVIEKQARTDVNLRFRYRYVLALAYLGRGDRVKAHEILSDLVSIEPGFAPAYTALASSYVADGKWEAAEFIARRGLDRAKEDAPLTNILGAIAAHSGNSNAARDYFNRAVTLAPAYAPALVNRANLSMSLGENQAAELDLQQATASAPSYAPAHVALGVCYRKTGQFKNAQSSFQRAIDADPENSLARFNLAVLYAQNLNQPNTAVRLFHEVMQLQDQQGELRDLARMHIEDLRERGLNTTSVN